MARALFTYYKHSMMDPEHISQDTPEDAAFRAAVEQGLVSLDSGRKIPYEDVRKWLLSWGTENEQSAPECL